MAVQSEAEEEKDGSNSGKKSSSGGGSHRKDSKDDNNTKPVENKNSRKNKVPLNSFNNNNGQKKSSSREEEEEQEQTGFIPSFDTSFTTSSRGVGDSLTAPLLQPSSVVLPSVHKVQFAAPGPRDEDAATWSLSSPVHCKQESLECHNDGDDCSCSTAGNSPAIRSPGGTAKPFQQKQRRKRTVSDASYFSSSSLPRSDSCTSTSYSFTAPDGGWGWVVVMASFLVNMIADGVTFSFGVLFVELQNEFSESKAITAGVVSLFHAVPLLSGPIASALTDKYGCRKMTIFGSLLATFGFLVSTLCQRLELLYLTFGVISGFGLSLCYVAAIVIVAYYFDRKRSFATGISVCGSGVGTFLFAPLTQYLIDEYGGWRGATIILAGFFLNMCVCGMMFKDLEWTRKRRKLKRQESNNPKGSIGTVSSKSGEDKNSSMPELNEIKDLLENGDIRALFSKEDLQDCPRLSSSLVNIPTFISNRERLPEEVIHALSKNPKAYKLIIDNYPEALQFILSPNEPSEDEDEESNTQFLAPEAPEPTGVKLKRKVSSLFKKRPSSTTMAPNRSILKKPPTPSLEVPPSSLPAAPPPEPLPTTVVNIDDEVFPPSSSSSTRFRSHPIPASSRPLVKNLHHLRVRRQSLTYRGAMLNISRYRLRASSCPDIYRNSMTTIAQEDIEEPILVSCFLGVKDFFADCCQCNFFNPQFIVFCLSNFVLYAWYDVMYVYLVDYAEKDLRFEDSTYLISIIGILNTIGEVLIGWLGDQSWMNLNLLYALCMLGCGISTAVVPFLVRYRNLAAMAGIYGLCISANYSLTSPILVELVSLEQFSHAYGLLLLVQGVSNLVGPPFAGYLYDISREWYLTFGLAGAFITFSGLLLLILPCFKRIRRRRRHCSQTTTSEDPDENQGALVDTVVVSVKARKSSDPIDIPRRPAEV